MGNKNTKKGISGSKKVAAVAGLAALSVGAYYLLGPNGKANQKKASALFAKMKKEVTSEVEKVQEVTNPIYQKAVDFVALNYSKQYKAHEKDIKAFAKKLKNEWKKIK